MAPTDLSLGRNGNHQYNLELWTPPAEELYKNGKPKTVKAAKPKHKFPGVTTVIGLLDKPGLVWAAARETAQMAVHQQNRWQHLDRDVAVEVMRKEFRRLWDIKADTGSIVHEIALAWARGEDADLEQLMAVDEKGRERDWSAEERAEVLRRVNGCVDALELFYLVERPQWRYVEQPIVNPGYRWKLDQPYKLDPKTAYGGCFDGDGELRESGDVQLDFKTGERYPTQVTLQMAGYGHAPLLAHYDDEGHLVEVTPYEAPAKKASVWLHDDGTYELLEVPADRSAYVRFIELRRQHAWLAEMRQWEKAHPAPETVEPGEIAPENLPQQADRRAA